MKRYEVYDRWITQVVELSNKLVKTLSKSSTDTIEYIVDQDTYGRWFVINRTWIRDMPNENTMDYNMWKQRSELLYNAIETLKSLQKMYDMIQPGNPPIPIKPKLASYIETCHDTYEEIKIYIRPKAATSEITIRLLKNQYDKVKAENLNPIIELFEKEYGKTEEVIKWFEEELPDNTLNFMAPTETIKKVKTRKLSLEERTLAPQSQKEVG